MFVCRFYIYLLIFIYLIYILDLFYFEKEQEKDFARNLDKEMAVFCIL